MEAILAQFIALAIGFGLGWLTPRRRRNGGHVRR
jgi:hypothetical protein